MMKGSGHMTTGKPGGYKKSDSKSAPNSAYFGSKCNGNTPKGGGGFPLSSKQSAGRTKHARMQVAPKVESEPPKGMPNVHTS